MPIHITSKRYRTPFRAQPLGIPRFRIRILIHTPYWVARNDKRPGTGPTRPGPRGRGRRPGRSPGDGPPPRRPWGPWETAPKYLLRDRDAAYGDWFRQRITSAGVEQVLTAPRSPWQHAEAERLIGSIRRECLNHVMVLSEAHLRRLLASYFRYSHRWRTHLSLAMDCPEPRPVLPPERGSVVAFPEVGGLHHHYERIAA